MIKNINTKWIRVMGSLLLLLPAYVMAATASKPMVTIYQVKSTVHEISPASATDMFITALVKTHRFVVLERQRLNESVYMEKQLNQQGRTTGNVADKRLTGAKYIFVATITEANASADNNGVSGTFGGLGVESSEKNAEIGMDVRILDASNGAIIDAINVRKKVTQKGSTVSGVGSFLGSMAGIDTHGADASISNNSSEGVDKALRSLIDQAVSKLAKRYGKN